MGTEAKSKFLAEQILILEETNEFCMIVLEEGSPICFRSLELFHDFSDETIPKEIVEEMRYTLLTLEAEYGPHETSSIEFWSESRDVFHTNAGDQGTACPARGPGRKESVSGSSSRGREHRRNADLLEHCSTSEHGDASAQSAEQTSRTP